MLTRFFPKLGGSLFLVGGLVGISRILRGSHFPTDVYTGAILGILVGSLAAVRVIHWRDQALPQLLRVGLPWVVVTFFVIWIILHRAPPWPQERLHLAVGGGFVLFGLLCRLWGGLHGSAQPVLRAVGIASLLLGIAVACAPWWMAALIVAAYLPQLIQFYRFENRSFNGWFSRKKTQTMLDWRGEVIAASAAVLVILLLRFLQGILPLAS